jgi:hypothetical protein
MARDESFSQVQLEYERLRADQPHRSHKELWRQAEDSVWSSLGYTRPPRWPVVVLGVSGALVTFLVIWLGFNDLDSSLTGAVAGNPEYESDFLKAPDLVPLLALVAWIGVLVGIAAVAATNRFARFGAFVGAAAWLIVSVFVWSLTLG